jgi:hypothetical protein
MKAAVLVALLAMGCGPTKAPITVTPVEPEVPVHGSCHEQGEQICKVYCSCFQHASR